MDGVCATPPPVWINSWIRSLSGGRSAPDKLTYNRMLTHFRRARNLQRYHKVISVFARHGFGSIMEALRINRYLPLPPSIFKQRARPAHLSPAEHLRRALEELGPTFIKLGQIISTRPDVFPPEYIVELSKLQDSVPPTPWEVVHKQLEEEYGQELASIFTRIDEQPLGSASLSQVHAAELADGQQVVIKIQRPKIQGVIQSDLDILRDLSYLAQRSAWGQLYNPVEIVAQFAYTLQNELDYRREGLNADRFRANFASEEHLHIPTIIWDYSTAHVLVMERLEGIKIDDLAALDQAGIDRRKLALHAARMLAKEIIEDGFFHADPHPGNFFVMPNGTGAHGPITIGAIDFGMVGHVSKTDRLNLIQAYALAAKMDAKGIVDHLVRMGAVPMAHVDLGTLERDVDRMLNKYRGLPLKHIQTRRVVEEMMQLAFHYRITLPPDMWLLFKTLTMLDGLARQLDPEVDVFTVFEPQVRRMLTEMHMPWEWGPALLENLESLALALRDVPSIGEGMLRSLQRGELPFTFSFGANKETLDRLDRVSNRFSLSLLTAAFILGLAILFPLASGNQVALALIAVGFLAALLLGISVVYSILRSGK